MQCVHMRERERKTKAAALPPASQVQKHNTHVSPLLLLPPGSTRPCSPVPPRPFPHYSAPRRAGAELASKLDSNKTPAHPPHPTLLTTSHPHYKPRTLLLKWPTSTCPLYPSLTHHCNLRPMLPTTRNRSRSNPRMLLLKQPTPTCPPTLSSTTLLLIQPTSTPSLKPCPPLSTAPPLGSSCPTRQLDRSAALKPFTLLT